MARNVALLRGEEGFMIFYLIDIIRRVRF